jgi:nicotinate-nucleotide adenylyltransferase
VPDGVVQYIAKYGLYDAPREAARLDSRHTGTNNAGNDAAGLDPAQHDPAFEITQPASTE